MSEHSNGGFSLQVEEVVATVAVLALTGFFLWQQLFHDDDAERSAPSVPSIATSTTHVAAKRSSAVAAPEPAGEAEPSPQAVATQQARALRLSCENPSLTPEASGRTATASASLGCGISAPALSAAERAQGVEVDAADEVVLGGDIEVVDASYSVTPADRGGVAATQASALAVTAVDIDQIGHRIRISGVAPADREQVQLVVNGRPLSPVVVSDTGRWEVVVPENGREFYLQLRGLNPAGDLVVEPGALESAYVISLRHGGDAEITVIPGQFHRMLEGEDAASVVSDFQIDRQTFDAINALRGNSPKPGQWVFVPLVAAR